MTGNNTNPQLAEVLRQHHEYFANVDQTATECVCGWEGDSWSEHVAAVWRDACTITTVEQLKQCPRGTAVLAADDRPFRRWPAENGEDHWTSGEIALPALLLWHPEWQEEQR